MIFFVAFDVAHNVTNIIATLPTWGPYFKLEFNINLTSFGAGQSTQAPDIFPRQSTTSNIIRYALADGGSMPALTADPAGFLHFTTFINGAEETFSMSSSEVNLDQWYNIIMQQVFKNDKVYTIAIKLVTYVLDQFCLTSCLSVVL